MLCLAELLNSGNLCLKNRELHLETAIGKEKTHQSNLINVKKKKMDGNTSEIIKFRENIRATKDF